MDFTKMTVEELEARRAAISEEVNAEGADLNALEEEVKGINAELIARREAADKQAEIRKAVAEGNGEVVKEFSNQEERKMFKIDSIEYRDAWTKKLIGRDLSEEERSALSSAGAVIPTLTVNAVWDRIMKDAELLAKVDVTRFASYVRYPKATTNSPATSGAVGSSITESSDVIGYVDLTPQEYVKLLTVPADIDHMAIDAVHDWIVTNLTKQISYAMNKDILVGTNSGAFKGITASVNANATALPGTITKAALLKVMGTLSANYQKGAIWIMTSNMFYNGVMAVTALNDYIVNNGFDFRLFGHDVVLMEEALVSSKETIFYGDPQAYKVNIFKPIEIKPFETATTTNVQFRGACMADGELLDTSAFVRFAQT